MKAMKLESLMKIEEVISLYEFLTNCGWLGGFAVWIALTIIIGAAVLWGKDKLDAHIETPSWKILIFISAFTMLLVATFKLDAYRRNEILKKANCIKSEFMMYGYKVASFASITSSDFHCDCDPDIIRKILDEHPNEFIEVKTDDEKPGIRIIDEKALELINRYNQSHIPFIKARLLDYMKKHDIDSLTYSSIRKNVNKDFDDEWIELMLSRYDSIFTPANTMDSIPKYGDTHYVKWNGREKHTTH